MKKTIRMSVDRREGALLVLIPDGDEEALLLPADQYALSVGDVVDITLEDGKVLSLTRCDSEAERRKKESNARLMALFAKGKKPQR